MVQAGQITFYTHPYSPYCHRVHLGLDQAKADYTNFVVNLMERPAWYAEKVNPAGKIPAITYGGPKVAPDDPSPESAKINESVVILEFLADVFPEAQLLPADPVLRAKARLFVNSFDTVFAKGWADFFFMYTEGAGKSLFDALEFVQAALPPTGFVVGQWSIAEIAAGPFLARLLVLLKHDLGTYPVGEGTRALKTLQGPRFARLLKYVEDVKAHPNFKNTWDESLQYDLWKQNPVFKHD
ncbi:thioredoxin-like protein [Trametes elegans]|nr:thioredoxin-like protein [Trametes elegans]